MGRVDRFRFRRANSATGARTERQRRRGTLVLLLSALLLAVAPLPSVAVEDQDVRTSAAAASNGYVLDWATSMGGTGTDGGYTIAVDPVGGAYVGGRFEGTVDFDPGPDVVSRTSAGSGNAPVLCGENAPSALALLASTWRPRTCAATVIPEPRCATTRLHRS